MTTRTRRRPKSVNTVTRRRRNSLMTTMRRITTKLLTKPVLPKAVTLSATMLKKRIW